MKLKHYQYRRRISQKVRIATVLFTLTLSSCMNYHRKTMNESKSNLTATATSISNLTPTATSNPTPTATSTINLTDLGALIDAFPANRLYPDAKPKPILATAVKAIKHAYAVADHTTPVDKTALATAKNYTAAARAAHDAAKRTFYVTDTAFEAAKAHLVPLEAALREANARLAPSIARAKADAQRRADLFGGVVNWRADEDLIQAAKKAHALYKPAHEARLAAFDAFIAAEINAQAALIALVATESAERVVVKVAGITPNNRYLDTAAATHAASDAAKTAATDRKAADALHSAARTEGSIFGIIAGATTTALTSTIILHPLISAGLACALAIGATATHSAASTEVHNAHEYARVSGAFADVTFKLVEKIKDLEALYSKIKKA